MRRLVQRSEKIYEQLPRFARLLKKAPSSALTRSIRWRAPLFFSTTWDTLTRTLTGTGGLGVAAQNEALRLKSGHRSITASIQIDAADQLEKAGGIATRRTL
jgi:hypothetical protein